jgi:hypothetical protein
MKICTKKNSFIFIYGLAHHSENIKPAKFAESLTKISIVLKTSTIIIKQKTNDGNFHFHFIVKKETLSRTSLTIFFK